MNQQEDVYGSLMNLFKIDLQSKLTQQEIACKKNQQRKFHINKRGKSIKIWAAINGEGSLVFDLLIRI